MSSVRYLLDEHIANAVAEGLRRRGVDVLTASEARLLGRADVDYLAQSVLLGRALVAEDADFLRLDDAGYAHAGIAYCQQGSRSVGEMIARLLLIHAVMASEELVGHVEYI